MLLHWCTLEPAGPSHIAAIRFSAPIRVKCIRIFPTGARPFSQSAETIACVLDLINDVRFVNKWLQSDWARGFLLERVLQCTPYVQCFWQQAKAQGCQCPSTQRDSICGGSNGFHCWHECGSMLVQNVTADEVNLLRSAQRGWWLSRVRLSACPWEFTEK